MGDQGIPVQWMTREERLVRDKRLHMLKAYADKSIAAKERAARREQLRTKETTILPLSPIKRPKEKKFNHTQGCTIAANGQLPPKISDKEKWWNQRPSVAGQLANGVQRKLSQKEFWTGTQKYRVNDHHHEHTGELIDVDDDQIIHRAKSLFSHDLSVDSAHRSASDTHAEVNFRVMLRGDT